MAESCVFCAILDGVAPATIVKEWAHTIAIVPRNPVTPGHVLVIPRVHVADAVADPYIAAQVMGCAAAFAHRPCNIITSAGEEATQTVGHLHVHIVPRTAGDGLTLPWTAVTNDA
jgi:histidine triad (HIT) family protein